MTSLPTLWRRRDWVILWLHSASFLMSLISFLTLRATGLLYDLPLTYLPLIPLSFFLLAWPFAFFIARKKRYSPSQIVAALPMVTCILGAIMALSFFAFPVLGGLGIMLGVVLVMWFLTGGILALCYSFPALIHTGKQITKKELVLLGCSQHQFETRIAAESTPADEPLILRAPHPEVSP